MRYDKLAASYLGFVQPASIRLWLRVNESTPEHLLHGFREPKHYHGQTGIASDR